MRTAVSDLLGIEHPIVQGAFGPWTTARLAAAITNAGGLGSLGTATRPPEAVPALIAETRELTGGPFAVNHTSRPFNEEAFALTLDAAPAVISYAIGDPGELPARAHAAGSLFMTQVNTVEQAEIAAERGVDLIVAQGAEAGGFCGDVATLPLVPQVVDAVEPIPVLAAGGIADGRGLAAALVLGAAGINIGTRFLAAAESGVAESWVETILAARSQDPVKAEIAAHVLPATEGAYPAVPRALPTTFIEHWRAAGMPEGEELERAREELLAAAAEGRVDELVPFTGQTAGMIDEVLPVAEIITGIVAGARAALAAAAALGAHES